MPDILVTIPAYNEQKSIGKVVKELRRELLGRDHTVVVVSDGSTDLTEEMARRAGAMVYSKPHTGLADTFRFEMRVAQEYCPRVIVHTDADGQYHAQDIHRLIKAVSDGADLVLGSRLQGDIEYMPFVKRALNTVATMAVRMVLNWNVTDVTTGFRAFTMEVARLPIKSSHTYTLEQIIRVARKGYRIVSAPVGFSRRRDGESRLISSSGRYVIQTARNIGRMLSK